MDYSAAKGKVKPFLIPYKLGIATDGRQLSPVRRLMQRLLGPDYPPLVSRRQPYLLIDPFAKTNVASRSDGIERPFRKEHPIANRSPSPTARVEPAAEPVDAGVQEHVRRRGGERIPPAEYPGPALLYYVVMRKERAIAPQRSRGVFQPRDGGCHIKRRTPLQARTPKRGRRS
jgi:hypothetical protein